MQQTQFRKELELIINRHSVENGSQTPDYILADYLNANLAAFDAAVNARSDWYGRRDRPGMGCQVAMPLGGDACAPRIEGGSPSIPVAEMMANRFEVEAVMLEKNAAELRAKAAYARR